jgi:uncharacterized protein (DUF362 family)
MKVKIRKKTLSATSPKIKYHNQTKIVTLVVKTSIGYTTYKV